MRRKYRLSTALDIDDLLMDCTCDYVVQVDSYDQAVRQILQTLKQ